MWVGSNSDFKANVVVCVVFDPDVVAVCAEECGCLVKKDPVGKISVKKLFDSC